MSNLYNQNIPKPCPVGFPRRDAVSDQADPCHGRGNDDAGQVVEASHALRQVRFGDQEVGPHGCFLKDLSMIKGLKHIYR